MSSWRKCETDMTSLSLATERVMMMSSQGPHLLDCTCASPSPPPSSLLHPVFPYRVFTEMFVWRLGGRTANNKLGIKFIFCEMRSEAKKLMQYKTSTRQNTKLDAILVININKLSP